MSSIKAIALAKVVGGGGGGGDTEIQALNVTQNGTYNPGSGKAYKPVTVNVLPKLQTKTAIANGDVEPDTGYDGLSKVMVNVPSSSPNLQSKTVTENGTVTPDQGYDGLSSVVVNVQGGGGIEDSINEIMGLNGTNYARLSASSLDKLLIGADYFQRDSNEPVVFLPCINDSKNYAGYAVISFNSSFTGTYSTNGKITNQGSGTTPKGYLYNKFVMPSTIVKYITDVGGIESFYINGVTAQITILNASVYISINNLSIKGDQQAIAALNAYLDRIYEVYYA